MNLTSIGIIYRKELIDTLRDRRTIISTIVLPILMFPVLILGFGFVAAKSMKKVQREGSTIMLLGDTNAPTLDLGCHLGLRAGENVGYLSNGINDVKMNAVFMASPGHRANILGPYHYVGVAWVVAPNGSAYIAVEFG